MPTAAACAGSVPPVARAPRPWSESSPPAAALRSPSIRDSHSAPTGLIAFPDLGPGPMGEEAIQIAILDVVTGKRRLVTQLPAEVSSDPASAAPVTGSQFFLDDETISFNSRE